LTTFAHQLRKNSTPTEKLRWNHLRRKQLYGRTFRRQHPISPYIVDFYCSQIRLVIEVDGEIHKYQLDQDNFRQAWLTECGFNVIRITNDQVLNNLDWVLLEIQKYIQFNSQENKIPDSNDS
jgi:leucyl-tRNA synthetase